MRLKDENGYLTITDNKIISNKPMKYLGIEFNRPTQAKFNLQPYEKYTVRIDDKEFKNLASQTNGKPLIEDHVYINNKTRSKHNQVGNLTADGIIIEDNNLKYINVPLIILDFPTIEKVEAGYLKDVSTFYSSTIQKDYTGQSDFVATNLVLNHLALLPKTKKGRSGAECCLGNSSEGLYGMEGTDNADKFYFIINDNEESMVNTLDNEDKTGSSTESDKTGSSTESDKTGSSTESDKTEDKLENMCGKNETTLANEKETSDVKAEVELKNPKLEIEEEEGKTKVEIEYETNNLLTNKKDEKMTEKSIADKIVDAGLDLAEVKNYFNSSKSETTFSNEDVVAALKDQKEKSEELGRQMERAEIKEKLEIYELGKNLIGNCGSVVDMTMESLVNLAAKKLAEKASFALRIPNNANLELKKNLVKGGLEMASVTFANSDFNSIKKYSYDEKDAKFIKKLNIV